MTDTRKLAAIMAIYVVGYSRLMGEDEAGTARAARAASRSGAACTPLMLLLAACPPTGNVAATAAGRPYAEVRSRPSMTALDPSATTRVG